MSRCHLPVPQTQGSDRSTRPLWRHHLRPVSAQRANRDLACGGARCMQLAQADTARDCVATGTPGAVAAARLTNVRRQVVNEGELVIVRTEETSPSQVKSSLVQQCTLLKFVVEKERPTRLEARGRGFGAGAPEDIARYFAVMYLLAHLWCKRDLDPRYQYSPPTAKAPLLSATACLEATERERQLGDDVRLLLFLVPVICLCPPRLISSHLIPVPISLRVVSSWTQNVGVQPQNLEHLQPPSTSPCSRLSNPCLSQGSGRRLVLLCAQCVRLPPTLIPFCNLLPPTLQLWRILHA